MSFRTRRTGTRRVYPISGTTSPTLDDIIMEKPASTQKNYLRYLTERINTVAPAKERYNGWYNYDTWATNLILTNDEATYRWLQSWKKNWMRKMANGTFVKEAAEYAVWKYLVPSAQGKSAPVMPETPEPRIERSQVNYGEIVDAILEE